ncbi:hypothetical protein K1T71_008101 [Dendrolimus kikuchii]|uniref:Uncharacterized protein n=1 Tax=Dendrolimus kikuchii TaxID=765133 RepID=A0ACC1CXT0_9NEOP|nr:hypothetical protein K1T71_008101 [Dendrolimus kikuchii]
MANDHTTLEIVNESPKESHKVNRTVDPSSLEMVFGSPNSPKTEVTPGVHFINNERRHDRHPVHSDRDHQKEPLLEPDRERQKPPLAGPEIDDLDDEKPPATEHFPGIDDGLLDIDDKKSDGHDIDVEVNDGSTDKVGEDGDHHSTHDDGVGTDDGKWLWPSGDEPDYPYDGTNLSPRFGIDDRPGSPMMPGSIPDVNTYQQKKNLAQGMMDLALLSANANQLRYVLESSTSHPYYYSSLTFISLSIIFQIAVGVGLIMNSRYDVNDKKEICKADKINNMTVLGIFLITIVNVFITSFSVATPGNTTGAVVPQQNG